MAKEKVPIDFHYFIQMTIQKDMTWNTLSFLLTDLAETQKRSKQVIKILVMELKEWVSKVENDSKLDVTEMLDANEKEANVQRQEDKENYEKQQEIIDTNEKERKVQIQEYKENHGEPQETTEYFGNSEDESILDDTEELSYDPQEEMLDENKLEIQTELSQREESNVAVDFPADDFYEFIGDNGTPNPVSSNDDEDELPTVKASIDVKGENGGLYIERQNDMALTNFDSEKEKKYQCSFCNKCFVRKADKERHERVHTGEKPYQCKVCHKAFSQEHHLKTHDKIHTGDKPFECKFCQKQFREKGKMTRHERIHTGEKPFQCQTCKKSFNDEGNLKKHERIHSGEKPFECKFCQKHFSVKWDMTRHERIHTGEKPFQCKTCKGSFRESGHLKKHERTHTQEKPFKCKICNTSYSHLHTLKRHQNIHN